MNGHAREPVGERRGERCRDRSRDGTDERDHARPPSPPRRRRRRRRARCCTPIGPSPSPMPASCSRRSCGFAKLPRKAASDSPSCSRSASHAAASIAASVAQLEEIVGRFALGTASSRANRDSRQHFEGGVQWRTREIGRPSPRTTRADEDVEGHMRRSAGPTRATTSRVTGALGRADDDDDVEASHGRRSASRRLTITGS